MNKHLNLFITAPVKELKMWSSVVNISHIMAVWTTAHLINAQQLIQAGTGQNVPYEVVEEGNDSTSEAR